MKNAKRGISLLLSLLLLLGAVAVGGMSASADGSVYEISSYADLRNFADIVGNGSTSACAILMNNIECKNSDGTAAADWTPIGGSSNKYNGTFDGDGHKITGLSTPAGYNSDDVGLFGQIGAEGVVKNLGLEDVSIKGLGNVGAVAGMNWGKIENCFSTGSVTGYDCVGGITGWNKSGARVLNCYNTGDISATENYVGGVVGDNDGTVSYCYNLGDVSGLIEVGGVAGGNDGAISCCYSAGNVLCDSLTGGVLGSLQGSGTVVNCYFDSDRCNLAKAVGDSADTDTLTGLSTDKMTAGTYAGDGSVANMAGFSSDIWLVKEGTDDYSFYPHLKGFNLDSSGEQLSADEIAAEDWPARIAKEGVYKITNYDELKEFADMVNGQGDYVGNANPSAGAILMNDIECKNSDGTAATDWTPIGNASNEYIGTFDGDGNVITGLSTPAGYNSNYVGLFGVVGSGGTVQNVGLEAINITGNGFTGGVAGLNKGGTVSHCYSTGSVKGSGNDAGGVVGANYGGEVTSCYSTGDITGSGNYTGGVAGLNKGGTVSHCYSTGSVKGSGIDTGGVAGQNYDGTVTNCYSAGNVTSSGMNIGGVVGQNYDGTVTNCYSAGNVTSSGMNIGGVVGYNNNSEVNSCYSTGDVTGSNMVTGGVAGYNTGNGRVTNCYSAGDVTGNDSYTGGVAGYNTGNGRVTNCYSAGSVTGKDYTGGVVGKISSDSTITNCYYDKSVCGNIGAINGADIDTEDNKVKGLTTAQMTGDNAICYTQEDIDSIPMYFCYDVPSDSPWLTKADGGEDGGEYCWFYPHLKGFDFEKDGQRVEFPAGVDDNCAQMSPDDIEAADWPAKAEISVTWEEAYIYTYNGDAQGPTVTSVTIGDTSVPEGTSVTYFKNAYSDENAWEWNEISNSPTETGKYKMVIRSGDEELGTKYFAILDPVTDYTVRYYKNTGDGWSTESVTPVDAGDYKAVITFLKAEDNGDGVIYNPDGSHAPIEKEFVIDPASITLTANSRGTDVYDGTEKTVSGFTSSIEGLTFNGVTANGSGTNAGSYAVTFSGVAINETRDATGNYVVTGTENGTLTINPAPVTLTANSGTENYDGTEKTVSGFTSSVEGLTFDGVTASGSGTEPGVYDVTFSGVTENETRDTAGNYVITGTADGTLTVNPVIKFVNEDGTILQSSAVALGEPPEYKGETPVKAETDEATYTFKGWSPEITAAEGNATYTATFTETKKEKPADDKPADDKPAAKAAIAIKGEDALTLGYKQNKTFTADTEGVPEGGKVQWYLNGEKAGEGKTFKVENPEDDYTVQSKIVDASGNTVAESETVKVTVKHGFFDKLKAWLTDLLLGVFAPLFSKFESVC